MPALCFENQRLKEVFLKSAPQKDGDYFVFEDLIEDLSGFKRPVPQAQTSTEKTVELLRESLILNAEHVEHCFSSLPATPKNETLKSALLEYINSNGENDWTSHVWQTVGLLKEKKISKSFPSEWTFVKDPDSRFLFQEFAKAFTYAPGVESVDLKPLGNCLQNEALEGSPLILSESAHALTLLSEALEETLKYSRKVVLAFAGKPEEQAFLSFRLKAKGISLALPVEDLKDGSLLNRVRNCSALPFTRRLQLYHALSRMKSGLPSQLDEAEFLEKAVEAGHLSKEEREIVQAPTEFIPRIEEKETQVLLLPWVCPPETTYPLFAFAGASVLEFDFESGDLTPYELELLFRAGFPLPRRSELRQERLNVLTQLIERGATIFSSLPTEELSSFPFEQKRGLETFSPKAGIASIEQKLPPQTFSATQLETYAVCPTRYLFSNRFKLRREPKGLDGLQLLHGQITHRAFELHFKNPEERELEASLKHYFGVAINETAPNLNEKHYAFRYLKLQYDRLIPRVVQLEDSLTTTFGKRKTIACEQEFTLDLHKCTFRGKIDRIDELSDGSLLVLDYKTGTIDFTPDHIRKGKHFQALLYLLGAEKALSKPVAGMLFYDLKETEARRGILIEERVSKEAKKAVTRGHTLTAAKYQELLEEGLSQSHEITRLIGMGEFSPRPSAENCSYCDISTFCRRAYGLQ